MASGSPIHMSKRINESLSLYCPCQDTLECMWYQNNQSLTNRWEIIPNKTDLILPANDWSAYGVIIGYCGSKNHTHIITNYGTYVCVHNALCL